MLEKQRYLSFDCLIIGEGSLLICCCEILLERGHRVTSIISSDESVLRWAQEKQITCARVIEEHITQCSFDYLFCIGNRRLLDSAILSAPNKYAVNFHDGPLPKYGGLNATSRALMNLEANHAVTWHVISANCNAGDILSQRHVAINQDETAFTLNGKCFEAAIDSFAQLIDELSKNSEMPKKRGHNGGTYFSRSKSPKSKERFWRQQGIFSWNRTAKELEAMARALDFGPYPNTLALPRLALADELFVIGRVKVLKTKSKLEPGVITEVNNERLKISTVTHEITVESLIALDGRSISIGDIAGRYGLKPGMRLRDIPEGLANRIADLNAELAQHESYWLTQLETLRPLLPPMACKPRVDREYQSKERQTVVLDEGIVKFLNNDESAIEGSDFLFTAFAAFLARLSGNASFDIGYSHDHLQERLNGLEGLFATLVPWRVAVDDTLNFKKFFREVRQQLEQTRSHQTYARDIVLRYPQLRSSPQSFPNLPVGFVSRTTANISAEMLEEMAIGTDLIFEVFQGRQALSLTFHYHPELYTHEDIGLLAQRFSAYLKAIINNQKQAIYTLPILSEREFNLIVKQWNATTVEYPSDLCFHHLFEEHARLRPDNIAVVFEGRQMTYKELNQGSNQLAHYLRHQGVRPETVVGICLERSCEMIVALLAVLKAGGAYLPLDPRYPEERLQFMLEDAQPQLLLTEANFAQKFAKHNVAKVYLDKDAKKWINQDPSDPDGGATAKNVAYIIYTSGSTGKPKGAMILHEGIANLARAQKEFSLADEHDRVLQFFAFSFDAAFWEIALAFGSGAELHMGTPESLVPGPDLEAFINDHEITVLSQTPSVLSVLSPANLPTVKTLIVGAEACWMSLVEQWAGGRRFFNGYGPTESTVCVTLTEYSGHNWEMTIGKPMANIQVYILDHYMQAVPAGVPGEIYIGGSSLARGYLNREQLTSEKFVNNPFSGDPNARLYKTGDMAKFLFDGNIDFLGRMDNQVKLRGYRIETEEIGTVILEHAAVKKAVVTVWEEKDDQRLVAYLVLRPGQVLDRDEMRVFLGRKLPGFMIPAVFTTLTEIPLMPNGKADLSRLPNPFLMTYSTMYRAPRTPLEAKLTRLWADIFKQERVGIGDNFFDLGDSLLAVHMIARLKKELDVSIPVSALFRAPTIAQFAGLMSAEISDADFDPLINMQPLGKQRPLFAVHPEDGNVFCYTDLVQCLGDDQPFYGFQASGVENGTSSGDMAARYIQSLQTVQPQGPYLLAGYSAGGAIAYEMAQQLKRQGESVDLLVLFDALAPYCQSSRKVAEVDPFDSRMDIFRAIDAGNKTIDRTMGWGEDASAAIDVYDVPGTHLTMLKPPNVEELSKTLRSCLLKCASNLHNGPTGMSTEPQIGRLEFELMDIWQSILRVKDIAWDDNFFALGGHSLSAIRMLAMVAKKLEVRLPIDVFFRQPTIKQFAQNLERYGRKEELSRISTAQLMDHYTPSAAQKRLFIQYLMDEDSVAYNVTAGFEFSGKLDVPKVEYAVTKLIERHESLRTWFDFADGELAQRIGNDVNSCMTVIKATNDKEALCAIGQFVQPFDLRKSPLFRVALIRLSDTDRLIIDAPHVAVDGLSMGILLREFAALYDEIPLAPSRFQYKDYSEWQRLALPTPEKERQTSFWLDCFKDTIPRLDLRTDHERPLIFDFKGEHLCLEIGDDLTASLKKLAESQQATLFMTMFAAFYLLLYKHTGQEDMVVGSPVADRPHVDLYDIVGMFVNMMPIRSMPAEHKAFDTFLAEVKQQAVDAYKNQDCQFDDIVERLGVKRDLSRNPLFDVVFVLQNLDLNELEISGQVVRPRQIKNPAAKFDLLFEVTEGDRIDLDIEYRTSLFNRSTIERMANDYVGILRAVVRDPSATISQIAMPPVDVSVSH